MSIYNNIRGKKDKNERTTAEILTVMNLGNRNVGDFSFTLQLFSSFPIFFRESMESFDINVNDAIHPTTLLTHARKLRWILSKVAMFCPSEIHPIPHFHLSPLENQSLEVDFAFHINIILLTTYLSQRPCQRGMEAAQWGTPCLTPIPILSISFPFLGAGSASVIQVPRD